MSKQSCLTILNGALPSFVLINDLWNDAKLKLCADGAIDKLQKINRDFEPDAIIGDGDSISQDNRYRFRDRLEFDDNTEQTDGEKCLGFAVQKGYRSIDVIGADGERTDHFLYHLALIRKFSAQAGVTCWTENEVVFYRNKPFGIDVQPGRRISFLPVFESAKIGDCSGLKYPMAGRFFSGDTGMSISNETTGTQVRVELESGGIFVFLAYN